MANNEELVSIVVPTYNAEKLLPTTLRSVIGQTYRNWELLVVDDGSTDGTVNVAAGFAMDDERVKLIRLEKNYGAPAAPRNIGVSQAKGRYIALLDSDDVWHPKKLQIQISTIAANDAPICCTQMVDFHDDSELVFEDPGVVGTELISFGMQRLKGRIPNSSVVVKATVLQENLFNELPAYKAVEDYDCWLRILAQYGSAIKIKYPLLRYRKTSAQISRSKVRMAQRVFRVHYDMSGHSVMTATLFTLTHVLGAIYLRKIRKRL